MMAILMVTDMKFTWERHATHALDKFTLGISVCAYMHQGIYAVGQVCTYAILSDVQMSLVPRPSL